MSVGKEDHSIHVVKELDTRLPLVFVDPVQMQQVFLNLVMNGVEAMPEGGTLAVRTHVATSGKCVEIEIRDTGKGIEEHMKEQLFRPFFTTKRKGTGLGLAITRRLLEMHGGAISVGNGRERGSVFTITLPLSAQEEVSSSG